MIMEKDKPTFINRGNFTKDDQYRKWISDVKVRFKQSQIKASIRVNTSMLEFYWNLGRDIVNLKAEEVWGSSVIQQLSLDLRDEFPGVKGLSYTNMKYVSQWYRFYNQHLANRQQVVGEIEMPQIFGLVPWGHHIHIMAKCDSFDEAIFYINKTVEGNWSRKRMDDEIASNLYASQGTSLNNFSDRLPQPQGNLANEILKDPYRFDFLSMTKGYSEKQLEDALAHNISRFLLELGKGFAYVGRQMELRMPNGQSFFPDMIFYHIKLKCYVVVELKIVDFIPEFAGKLNFYVSAADNLLKGKDDNPSIGLLICKSKDETIVKWSFQDINKPIGVASYELSQLVSQTLSDALPSIEDIENGIE